jgi:catechol 2,3-dioxygenase-like lactoylglutathione lyase family enzyme
VLEEETHDISIGKTTPILRIFDEAKAKEFYVDFLGFKVDWEHRFEEGLPLYMQVSRDGCVLHPSEHHGDGTPGVAVRIETNVYKYPQAAFSYADIRGRSSSPATSSY